MFIRVKNEVFSVIVLLNLTLNRLDRLWHHFRVVGQGVFLCGAVIFPRLGLSLNFIGSPCLVLQY